MSDTRMSSDSAACRSGLRPDSALPVFIGHRSHRSPCVGQVHLEMQISPESRWTSIELGWKKLSTAQCAAFYFAEFDADGGATGDRDWDEASNGAFFRNFFSGMS